MLPYTEVKSQTGPQNVSLTFLLTFLLDIRLCALFKFYFTLGKLQSVTKYMRLTLVFT